MIELTLTELAALVVALSMGVVVAFEWASRWSLSRSERRGVSQRVCCRVCLLVIVDEGRERVFRCPHCGAENERGRNKSLG